MNKLFRVYIYIFLISVSGIQAQDLQEKNKEFKQEQVVENQTELRKKINKIKESGLGKWAQANPKKSKAVLTLLALEVVGISLIYSPLGTQHERKVSIVKQLLVAPVFGPYIALHGLEKICEKIDISKFLISVIIKIKYPMKAWAALIN